jgi:hypothetical protein
VLSQILVDLPVITVACEYSCISTIHSLLPIFTSLSRYCTCKKTEYNHIYCDNTRDAKEDWRYWEAYESADAVDEERMEAKRWLEDIGVDVYKKNPFLLLRIFRQYLWKRFGLNYLHVSLEGNWLKIFKYVGLELKNDNCKSE